MRKLLLALVLAPVAAVAGSAMEFGHTLKGPIVAVIEKEGQCHAAFYDSQVSHFSNTYYHVEDRSACTTAKLAYQLGESVVAKLHIYTKDDGTGVFAGITDLELNRDAKAYWPPYGRHQ